MSGSMGSIGGVDSSIPLRAGTGLGAPTDPMERIGKFATVSNAINTGQIQQQQLQSGKLSLFQQMKQTAMAHLAPLVANGDIKSMSDFTTALARLEGNGVITQPFIQTMSDSIARGGDFNKTLRDMTVAGMQPPEKVGDVLYTRPGTLDVGGQIIPTLTGAPGTSREGQVTTPTQGFEKGYTPGERLPTLTRKATQADVDRDPRLTIGQDIPIPATEVVKPYSNPGIGGARLPQGGLGPGGYQPPKRALDQLGPAYRPPGAPASPTGIPLPPGAGTPPIPGARLMKGAGGAFWVPAEKVELFKQNGYQ